MPGDVESLVRLPYEMITGNESPTFLPTSEDIEKRLPFRSDTPVSRAASGLGILGGGFYTGPGSGVRAITAVPKAVKRAGLDFAQSISPVNVIKPKGGNWLTGSVEGALKGLKRPMNQDEVAGVEAHLAKIEPHYDLSDPREVRELADMRAHIQALKQDEALNNWVDRNLTNYVKKEMATPEDPVRRLAEEGITHLPNDTRMPTNMSSISTTRSEAGFPDAMGTSREAQLWEALSDKPIGFGTAGEMINVGKGEAWMDKVDPFTRVNVVAPTEQRLMTQNLGFDHILDVLRQDVASGRIRPEQLNKISMEQAVRRTAEFDQEMAKKMREAQIKATEGFPVTKEYPEGYKWIELTAPKDMPSGYIEDTALGGQKIWAKEGTGTFSKTDPRHRILENALKYEGETMGHCVGGYCPDVMEGRSRIYSLRDAKGEPHVTVETSPGDFSAAFNNLTQEEQAAVRKVAGSFASDEALLDAMKQVVPDKANIPENIVQIKGKQNRAPNPEYLPFVQDFVRSGEWSDVGDLRNTGLIDMKKSGIPWPENTTPGAIDQLVGGMEYGTATPKYKGASELTDELVKKSGKRYVTQQEFDDLLLQELRPPAPEGMKRGGGVHFSDNPDVMQLELAGGGGVKALLKAAKEAVKPPIKASEALGSIEGRPLVITQADRTKVGGGFLGGPGFSGLQLEDPAYRAAEAAWAVKNPGTAKMILGGRGESKDAVYAAMLGTPTQHQSNQMVFDKLLGDFKRAAKKGELEPELRDRINLRLANSVDKDGNNIFPPDVDILDKNFKDLASTFDRRSVTANLIGGMGVGGKKGQIIDYDKIIRNTTDPVLIDAPTGALGNRLFTLNGGIIDRPDLHPAFPTIMQGEDLGVSFDPVARNLIMRDFTEKTMREKGRAPGIFDYTRGYPPSQLITEDILTDLQKMGKKAGGAVKVEQQVQGSAPTKKKSEHHVQNPVHFTESPDVMRLALTKRN